MAKGTFFHERTVVLNKSNSWIHWGEYILPTVLGGSIAEDYDVLRSSAAIFDCSGFGQYHIRGRRAAAMLDYVVSRNVTSLGVGRVMYTPWCNPDGKVRLDGTVFRFDEDHFMVCSEPDFDWFKHWADKFDVEIVNRRGIDAVLAVQGPGSYRVLENVADIDVRSLSYYRLDRGKVAGVPATVSRTGYSGDLGFEIWFEGTHALRVWDALVEAGRPLGARPCGLRCYDIARVEAGLIFAGTEYVPAAAEDSSEDTCFPFEIGLDWAVNWNKADFIGLDALRETHKTGGGTTRLTGILVDTPFRDYVRAGTNSEPKLEEVVHGPLNIYDQGTDALIGRISSRVSSPLLGRHLAMARVDRRAVESNRAVEIDGFFEQEQTRTTGQLVELPFVALERTQAPLDSLERRDDLDSKTQTQGH